MLEGDNALLSMTHENEKKKIYENLLNQHNNTPFKPLSAVEIESELAEARTCYERGEYEDFDEALDSISQKYDL
jgi:hypothetical protein